MLNKGESMKRFMVAVLCIGLMSCSLNALVEKRREDSSSHVQKVEIIQSSREFLRQIEDFESKYLRDWVRDRFRYEKILEKGFFNEYFEKIEHYLLALYREKSKRKKSFTEKLSSAKKAIKKTVSGEKSSLDIVFKEFEKLEDFTLEIQENARIIAGLVNKKPLNKTEIKNKVENYRNSYTKFREWGEGLLKKKGQPFVVDGVKFLSQRVEKITTAFLESLRDAEYLRRHSN